MNSNEKLFTRRFSGVYAEGELSDYIQQLTPEQFVQVVVTKPRVEERNAGFSGEFMVIYKAEEPIPLKQVNWD